MKDAYAFTQNEEQFAEIYQDMTQTYLDIYNELGLEAKVVASDNGFIGGDYCHEFIVDSDIGESRYLQAEGSDYVAHEDIAVFVKQDINSQEAEEQLTEVDADRSKTVEAGAELHGLPLERQIKNVAFSSKSKGYVLAVIRADLEVNVRKLENLLGVIEDDLEPMEASDVIDVLGSYPGFISPVGIKENLKTDKQLIVVGDDSLRTIKNGYTGANTKKRDLLNVNIDRDYFLDLEGDIALAKAGYMHANGGKLVENLGIEVGNIFQNGWG
jgi:prolyl-tRNA synthetase